MTVTTSANTISYEGNGSTTEFSFPYLVFQSSHLEITIDGSSTTAWSATGYGDAGGLTVTFDSAPADESVIVITRTVPLTQSTDLQNFDGYPSEVTEKQFDLLAMADQQIDSKIERSILVPVGTTLTSNEIGGTINTTTRVLAITSSGVTATALSSFPSDVTITETSSANNDFLVKSGDAYINKSLADTKTLLGVGSGQLAEEGSNVASAGTTDIGAADSSFIEITGTTTITSFGTTTDRDHIWIKFAGALTLTHNATSLILPTGANITTAAGDSCEAIRLASGNGNWKVVNYQRADGSALVTELSVDTSPQLGGVLDTNAKQVRWSKGADVASAGALSLGNDGNYFDITGTTTITSIGTKGAGTVVMLQFDGALTLTHHATDLVLPTSTNITTAAGDHAVFIEYATGDWRCISYLRANGLPLAIKDEDNMASDSASHVPTQQSVKAYVDSSGSGWTYVESGTLSGVENFTGLSGVSEFEIAFEAADMGGGTDLLIKIGDSGGIETTGYVAGCIEADASPTFTSYSSGFGIKTSSTISGFVRGTLIDNANHWALMGSVSSGAAVYIISGQKELSGTLDRIQLDASTGSGSFSGGKAHLKYR